MTPAQVQALFEDGGGNFRFARWSRPIVPVVFGVEEATLAVVKGAIEAVAGLAGHQLAETDPEMGANLMIFFLRDWDEVTSVPDLEHLVPELPGKLHQLKSDGANQYRLFRFEEDGSVRAAFLFLRMDGILSEMAAVDLALGQAVRLILVWGQMAFAKVSPLATLNGQSVLRPEIAALVKAAYQPELPAGSEDKAMALRLFARLNIIDADLSASPDGGDDQ